MWDGFWKLTRYCSQMACVPSSFNNAHLTRTSCIRAENLLHDPCPLKLIRCYRCRVYASIGYVEIKGECSCVVWYEYAKGCKEEQSTHIFMRQVLLSPALLEQVILYVYIVDLVWLKEKDYFFFVSVHQVLPSLDISLHEHVFFTCMSTLFDKGGQSFMHPWIWSSIH